MGGDAYDIELRDDLLHMDQNNFNIKLQKLYMSRACQCFYIILALVCTLLVVWTFFQRKATHSNFVFIIFEFLMNVIIIVDFIFKLKITGVRRYFKSCSNRFDTLVIMGCVVTYILYVLTVKSVIPKIAFLEKLSEEILFFIWSAWQYMRIIMFIKNQKKTSSDANKLIDFSTN